MIADAPTSAGRQFTDVVLAARAYITTAKVLARPAVRSLMLALASGAVEIVLPMVRSAK